MYFPSFNFWRNAGTVALASSPAVKKSIETTGDLYIVNTPTTHTRETLQQGRPDLVVKRTAVLAGLGPKPEDGMFPGPIINGWKGDTLSITVHNKLKDKTMFTETTIHWHGIEMHETYWADGVAFVTQCPIIPGDKFTYTFPVPDQAGTFWYHSHYQTQYCDGLRGPLIIRDRADPYLKDYDVDNDDTVITLADWFMKKEAFGDSTWELNLINGGVKPQVDVVHGKKYRFRLINTSCHAAYTFSIDGHVLTVIEVEGVLTKKYDVTRIPIHAGQRYSFILDTTKTKDTTINYWIRADILAGRTQGRPSGGRGVLHYVEADEDKEPTTEPFTDDAPQPGPQPGLLVEANIEPYDNKPAPGAGKSRSPKVPSCSKVMEKSPGRKRKNLVCKEDLKLGFDVRRCRFLYQRRALPIALRSCIAANSAGKVNPYDVLPKNSVIPLPRDADVQITFLDRDAITPGMHPMHLHGHTFSVVRSVDQEDYNWDNPPRRDTVATASHEENATPSEVTIRFRTDNPGPWILHCHMDRHLVEGLAIVFAEDTKQIRELEGQIPGGKDKVRENCQKYYSWMAAGMFRQRLQIETAIPNQLGVESLTIIIY